MAISQQINKINQRVNPVQKFVIKELIDANFETEVLKKTKPVYVLFYSNTCALCADMLKTLNEIGLAFNKELEFYKINVNNNRSYASKYAGSGMPCSVIFQKGDIIRNTRILDGQSVWTGNAANLQYFINWINNVLNVAGEKW